MKRLLIAILCLLSITAAAVGIDMPEEPEECAYAEEMEPVCAEEDTVSPPPEELFYAEKQQATEDILPELGPEPYIPRQWTDDCADVISRMVWGEARGVSRNEQKLVVWTVINRLENGRYGSSLIGVVRARGQFTGYSPRFPVTDAIREMVVEVLEAWDRGEEAKVYPPFARTPNYLYFHGDGQHNWFRERHR